MLVIQCFFLVKQSENFGRARKYIRNILNEVLPLEQDHFVSKA